MKIAKSVYAISMNLPKEERYGFASQIQRAAVSIPSNIAVGSARSGEMDFKKFLEIAMGSAFELETQLVLIKSIGLIKDINQVDSVLAEIMEVQKMLNGLISKIRTDFQSKSANS